MAWTGITRRQYVRDGLRNASDMTDDEWMLIEPFMPAPGPIGRPRTVDLRTVVNAILFMASTGCQWRQMPKDFPPYSTVQGYFHSWSRDGTFATINHALVMASRDREGREASPSTGVSDSQSVKTTESGGPRGYDAEEKSKAASGASSPTPPDVWSACKFPRPTSRIAMAPSVSSPRSVLSIHRCAIFLLTTVMPATSCAVR